MKKLLASLLCAALVIATAPVLVAQPKMGSISGTATVEGKPQANTTVRVRNVDTGALAGTMQTNAGGQFTFAGLPAGNYVVETVGPDGKLLGTSTALALTAGAVITGVVVSTSAAAAAAAAAVVGGAFFASTAGIITIAAVGTGVAAAVVVANDDDASPSQ